MLFLKEGCELGIILPDSILTNHYFQVLRRDLLCNHNVKSIIQLPDKVFNKTEARTHIMIIEKNRKSNYKIEVSKASFDGEIIDTIMVENSKLIQRMDYDYHRWHLNLNGELENYLTLKDITISISRGNKTKKYLKDLNIPYFHTTSNV